MKMRTSREEVKERLVTDAYFRKGCSALKIRQTLLTVFIWLLVLVPFIWLMVPLILPGIARRLSLRIYFEEIMMLEYLALFLGSAFLFLTLLFVALTLRNNRRFKYLLQKRTIHDEEGLQYRKELIELFYEQRFGSKEDRQSLKYYVVSPDKNIAETEIQELFRRKRLE